MRERVVLLLPSPTGFPLSSLSTACIRRRPSSPLVQRHACSSTPCAPARHRRPAPRLSARPRPKARLLLPPCAHARHRRPSSRRHVNPPDRRLPPPVTGGALATAQQHGTAAPLRAPCRRNGRLHACRRVVAPAPGAKNFTLWLSSRRELEKPTISEWKKSNLNALNAGPQPHRISFQSYPTDQCPAMDFVSGMLLHLEAARCRGRWKCKCNMGKRPAGFDDLDLRWQSAKM